MNTGWIILSSVLTLVIILLIFIWTFSNILYTNQNINNKECTSIGDWGVLPNTSANVLNRCGVDNSDPCVFPITSLSEAVALCNQVKSFCSAFVYNESNALMTIVDYSTLFSSPGMDLFARQSGVIMA